MKKLLCIGLSLLILAAFAACSASAPDPGASGEPAPAIHNEATEPAADGSASNSTAKPGEAAEANKLPPEEASPVSPEAAAAGAATTGQQNALEAARNYFAISAFSYDGLISQLEFEGYTEEESVYAAKNCGADWKEQALKKAKEYLALAAFSHKGLIAQLEFDQFTSEQAGYAADNCKADWKEQAVQKAKAYLELSSFSREGLIAQLEFDGFTSEQAVYGAEQNGY